MALQPTVYLGTFAHCKSATELEVLEDAAVGVDEHGTIAWIERIEHNVGVGGNTNTNINTNTNTDTDTFIPSAHPAFRDAVQVDQRRQGRFFFPGFIDTHIHASQFQNSGIFGKTTLLDWLRKYTFPTEVSFADLEVARRVYTKVVQMTLAHGTTTSTYYTTIHVDATNLMAEICHKLGQRAFVGRVCMDSPGNESWYRDSSPSKMIEATQKTIDFMQKLDPEAHLISPIITPRSALQCTREGLNELGKLSAQIGLPVQTHVSENRREIDAVKELFPHSSGYVDVYDQAGLLGSKTVLAHAIHFTPEEQQRVKETQCKISHCPVSNTSIASGLAPIREMLDAGIDVGLGTDVSGGYSPSILTAAREASGVSRLRASLAEGRGASQEESDRLKLSVEECLYLATRGGAKALNLSDKVGGFEVGKLWDAQLIDLGAKTGDVASLGRGNVVLWDREDWEETLAKWLFCGDDRNTVTVWVRGRRVHSIDA